MNTQTFSRIVRPLATFFYIFSAVLSPPTLNAAAQEELIINGDFELGNTGWTFSTYNANIVSSGYDGVTPHGGTKMAFISGGGVPGIPDGYIEQTFTIPEGTPYLSFWWSSTLTCGSVSGGRCAGTLSVSINGTPFTSFSIHYGGTTPWQRIVLDTYSYRGSTVTIRFSSFAFRDGMFNYIDDITFTGSVPRTFSKTNPADNAANQPSNPTLSWGDSPTATEYWVCYDTTDDNECTDWVSNGASTVKPLNSLLADTSYYWQVKAVNSYGTTYANGDSAAFWSFKTPAIGAPALTYLFPAVVVSGSPGFTLTIVGADFTGFVDGAQVFWNGEVRPTTFVSPTQLTAEISAADIATSATVPIIVKNPDLVESNALSVIVYTPKTVSGNAGAGGVTLSYTDGTSKAVMADNSGNYSFTVTYNWSGTVSPSKAGYVFLPANRTYTNVLADQTNQNYEISTWPSWYGGAVVTSSQDVVAVGRPHIGSEVASYTGFASGSTTQYIPMLFKQMWGSYDSALYIQNTDTANDANITIKFYDPDGTLNCTKTDTISAQSSKGYWMPSETCLPANWYGGVVITADRNIVAVGRPHIGNQVMTYNGFSSGSLSMYVPMLFKQQWGYDSAFYVQNTDAVDTANVTIKFYDPAGTLNCEKTDTIPPLSSHGYWLPSETCLPANWYGGVVVTSDKNIVAVGRPHIGSEVTTYNGFPGGSTTMYAPMLFKDAGGGSYDSALYVQNVHATNPANVTLKFYYASGGLTCTKTDTILPGSSKGYWLPDESCLWSGWEGSVKVESDQPVVSIGRPHLGSSITAYDGIGSGGMSVSVPMLFKQMWGSYDSALYLENTDPSNTANVTTAFYDVNGNLSCVKTDTIPAMGVLDYWLPDLTCSP